MVKYFPYITRTIFLLSLVSLFTDMASEMLYPVMPIYLQSIGFSVLLISILEGLAETIAGLSKGYFGQLSDIKQRRLPFVQLGYFMSAISKPLMSIFIFPAWIFITRAIDRIGKGIRTAPRDAILSLQTTKEDKAKVFGFHRSMDTLGAVFGPALALVFLFFYPENYRLLFLIAFIPGIAATCFTLLLKEKKLAPLTKKKIHFFSFLNYLKQETISASPEYKRQKKAYLKLLIGLLIFALANSSDVLLILKIKSSGINDTWVIGIYIFYNLVFALFAFPAGIIADKLGIKKTFTAGIFIFMLVYAGFAISDQLYQFIFLFILYGIYAACTDGIAKAWITNTCPPEEAGIAIGTYSALASCCAFGASTIAGLLWFEAGAFYAFGFSAIIAGMLLLYFINLNSE